MGERLAILITALQLSHTVFFIYVKNHLRLSANTIRKQTKTENQNEPFYPYLMTGRKLSTDIRRVRTDTAELLEDCATLQESLLL